MFVGVRVREESCDGGCGRSRMGVMWGAGLRRGRICVFVELCSEYLRSLYHYVRKGTKWSFMGLRLRFTWFAEVLE